MRSTCPFLSTRYTRTPPPTCRSPFFSERIVVLRLVQQASAPPAPLKCTPPAFSSYLPLSNYLVFWCLLFFLCVCLFFFFFFFFVWLKSIGWVARGETTLTSVGFVPLLATPLPFKSFSVATRLSFPPRRIAFTPLFNPDETLCCQLPLLKKQPFSLC